MLLNDLSASVKDEIRQLAIASYDQNQEACGLVCGESVIACPNKASDSANFYRLDGRNLRRRDITAIWHSHNNGRDEFSPFDIEGIRAAKSNVPHILHEVENDRWRVADPSIEAELLGTQFTYGIHDCYSIVRAWYWQKLRILLKDYDRSQYRSADGSYCWQADGWDEFRKYFAAEGFVQLPIKGFLQTGDVLLMCLHGCNPNHLAIVTDSEKEIMLHQRLATPSSTEQWDGFWRENTIAILRKINHDSSLPN